MQPLMSERVYKILRFGIAGALATGTNITTLYLLHDGAGVWYIPASICAFLVGFVVSFTLQKFWTFRDRDVERWRKQAATYFGIVVCNLTLNTIFVYLFVEYGGLIPVLAQAFSSILIALESFFVYQLFVFRTPPTTSSESAN